MGECGIPFLLKCINTRPPTIPRSMNNNETSTYNTEGSDLSAHDRPRLHHTRHVFPNHYHPVVKSSLSTRYISSRIPTFVFSSSTHPTQSSQQRETNLLHVNNSATQNSTKQIYIYHVLRLWLRQLRRFRWLESLRRLCRSYGRNGRHGRHGRYGLEPLWWLWWWPGRLWR
jgi:hypothetical protein